MQNHNATMTQIQQTVIAKEWYQSLHLVRVNNESDQCKKAGKMSVVHYSMKSQQTHRLVHEHHFYCLSTIVFVNVSHISDSYCYLPSPFLGMQFRDHVFLARHCYKHCYKLIPHITCVQSRYKVSPYVC